MTEGMQNAQARAVAKVGKALSTEDKIAILYSLPLSLLTKVVNERTEQLENRITDIENVVNNKTSITANNQGLGRLLENSASN